MTASKKNIESIIEANRTIPTVPKPKSHGRDWSGGWGDAPNRVFPGYNPHVRKYELDAAENIRQYGYSQATLLENGEHLFEGESLEGFERALDADYRRQEKILAFVAPEQVTSLLIVSLKLFILALGCILFVIEKIFEGVATGFLALFNRVNPPKPSKSTASPIEGRKWE